MSTLFPQYTYFHSDHNGEKPIYAIEHVLYPTLSWISHCHFTNPLSLPLYNTPYDNEVIQHPTLPSNNSTNPNTVHANRIQTITNQIHCT